MLITPNGKLAVIILPCGNRSTNLPVRQTVNTALKAFAPHPSFEVKHSLDSDTGFFHAGILTDKLSEVMREIKAQCPEVEDIIILGGTYARHPSDSNVETYVLPISQEFPQATFHFLYPGTLYFVAEDGETDFTANDLHQKEPRIEGLNARHWTSLEKMYMHFAGNDRERAIASLGEAVRIHVQGTAYLPATSVPVFMISAPHFHEPGENTESYIERKYRAGIEWAKGVPAGDNGEAIVDDNPVEFPNLPNPGHYNSRLALIRKVTELGYAIRLLVPWGYDFAPGHNRETGEKFVEDCQKAGGNNLKIVSVRNADPRYLSWLRNVALQVGWHIIPSPSFEDSNIVEALGLDPRRRLPPSQIGTGGAILLGEGFALAPDYDTHAEGELAGLLPGIDAREYLKALGHEVHFLPPSIIDLLGPEVRRKEGVGQRILSRNLDLDYKILLLRRAGKIFVSADYYGRFQKAVDAVLKELSERFGYSYSIVEEQFGLDLNVPEMPDGSVVIPAACTNLTSALRAAGVKYHEISWETTDGDISCGPHGGLRCAGNFF
jgi:hypothetical protein